MSFVQHSYSYLSVKWFFMYGLFFQKLKGIIFSFGNFIQNSRASGASITIKSSFMQIAIAKKSCFFSFSDKYFVSSDWRSLHLLLLLLFKIILLSRIHQFRAVQNSFGVQRSKSMYIYKYIYIYILFISIPISVHLFHISVNITNNIVQTQQNPIQASILK